MRLQKMKLLLLVLLIFSTTISFGQAKYEWNEASSGGYTYKYVTNDPLNARFYTLKNGLTVILSPTKRDPRIQTFIAIRAGAKTDPADHTGLAHYLEHMLFKGTDKYGSLDWAKEKPELEKITALYDKYNQSTDAAQRKAIYHEIDSVSGVASSYAIANEYDKMMTSMGAQGTNAFTSFEQTVYTENIPSAALDKYLAVQAERFRNPVFRIFHTELEAVYEEKNRGLDNDNNKIFETLFAELFKNHNYGKQTVIGTIEHLKNPSLRAIRNYYNTYYVPNNMGIIMSGDFDPDEVIKKIDKDFAYMQPKPVQRYSAPDEVPFTEPVIKEVVGPESESVAMAYRLPGIHSEDAIIADLAGSILTNGNAGLMDLNLVKKQKLLGASAFVLTLIDHGMLYLRGRATQGQSLEEVKSLLLGEIDKLKKGEFDSSLLTAIINNNKKEKIEASERFRSRANELMEAYTNEQDWKDQVSYIDRLSKITKNDVVAFANKYFGNNYVAIFKRKGVDPNVEKVEKPPISPVETNPAAQSAFVKMVDAMPENKISPQWVNFDKDMQQSKLGQAPVLYVQNKTNALFRLRYRYNIGSWNDKRLALAAEYLQFLGTDKMSPEDITKEFYKLACSFNVRAGEEYTTVLIEGLEENYDKAVALFENLIKNCKPDEEALKAFKASTFKFRSDAKLNKASILNGLTSYARYGAKNPFNYTMTDDELNKITAAELVEVLHNLGTQSHTIIYYGPKALPALIASLKPLHKMPETFAKAPAKTVFTPVSQTANTVYFTNYNMVQSEVRWVRNSTAYNPQLESTVSLFNNYFGGGMSSIVFQTIRESKALAYSTFASYAVPQKKEDPFNIIAYVGSQADKFGEATAAMNELLSALPDYQNNLTLAKANAKKSIETDRINQDGIIMAYLRAKEKGINYDIRKNIYEDIDGITYSQLKNFHEKYIANKPYSYCIVASEDKIKTDDMSKLGTVKKVSLEEIFGY